jgi:hypothetical protein
VEARPDNLTHRVIASGRINRFRSSVDGSREISPPVADFVPLAQAQEGNHAINHERIAVNELLRRRWFG